jgi:hypothetical protein
MEDHLLEEEYIITRTPEDEVVLTSHRIRHRLDNGNRMISIMLDNVNSIQSRHESKPVFIGIAILSFVAAGILSTESNGTYSVVAGLVGVICVIIYFASLRNVITIYSTSSSIEFQTKGMDQGKVLSFVNSVEEARKKLLKL